MTYPIAHAVASYYVATFKDHGIRTTDKLLNRAAEVRGRKALAIEVNIPEMEILDSVNIADLKRIKGLGVRYIKLLRHVGVATVRELRCRNTSNLWAEMQAANGGGRFVDFLPPEKLVARWIEHAKKLPLKVTYR